MRGRCFAVLLLVSSFLTPMDLSRQSAASSQTSGKTSSAERQSFEELSRAADRARNENRDAQAIRLYQHALAPRPTWPEDLWDLGTLLYENERYANARAVLRRFVMLEPAAGAGRSPLGDSPVLY